MLHPKFDVKYQNNLWLQKLIINPPFYFKIGFDESLFQFTVEVVIVYFYEINSFAFQNYICDLLYLTVFKIEVEKDPIRFHIFIILIDNLFKSTAIQRRLIIKSRS